MTIKKEYLFNIQGTEFVKYAGLLDEAHQQGLCGVSTTLIQIPDELNGNAAIVHAEVKTPKGSFSGLGDANPNNVGRMIAPHIIRMAECVPLSAKILTRTGWKYHDEVRLGEEVLAYDKNIEATRWTPLINISRFQNQPTVRLHSRSFDVTCTPDHSWVVERPKCKSVLRKANDFKSGDSIRVAAPGPPGESPLTPQEAAILGWLATDGTVQHQTVGSTQAVIRQSKPHYVAELQALTAGIASHTSQPGRQRDFGAYISDCLPQHTFGLAAEFTRQLFDKAGFQGWGDLTEIVVNLSLEARRAMLDAMLKGDGSQNPRGIWTFGKKRKPGVMEAFEILATLSGVALGKPRISSVGEVPVRTLRNNDCVTASYLKREEGPVQDVWCPTTLYGTWVMNLDGCITITGNTRAIARALRLAVNIGATSVEELISIDDVKEQKGQRSEGAATPPNQTAPGPTGTPKAPSPDRPASANQLATVEKLSRLLGRTVPDDVQHWTSEQASTRITELSRSYNELKGNTLTKRSA